MLELLKQIKRELKRGNDAFADRNIMEKMLSLSKCPDFVINKGHYFGTSLFPGEPGLSDAREAGPDRVSQDDVEARLDRWSDRLAGETGNGAMASDHRARNAREGRRYRNGPGSERPPPTTADFIVVGSGAGGGTLAARLAETGFRVLLLEAGGDPRTSIGSTPQTPGVNTLPDDYDVPAFHALSTENAGMRWDFFVRHYADDEQQKQDPKHRVVVDGEP